MNTIRLTISSILLCVVFFLFNVLSFADSFVPEKATGSLLTNSEGKIIGSRLIAQAFTSDRYFHPRPSTCDYNARAASGSNLSPNSPKLTERARKIIAETGATDDRPIPADLVTVSGSGLDPDITTAAALFQVERVARARGLKPEELAGWLPAGPVLNVLELNLALDGMKR